MSKKLFDDYQPDPEDDPMVTETFLIRFTLNTRYSSVETAAEEIAESIEWLVPHYGNHTAILQAELLDEAAGPVGSGRAE